jgi:uncharacterized protein (TIGR03067 family)
MKATITTILLFTSTCLFLSAGEQASDLEKFQGKWVVVTLTEQGKAIPPAETDLLEFTIEKDLFTVTEKGKVEVQYKIAMDASKTPKEINFTHQIGENKDKTELGIYQFEKDQIRFCMDETRKGRPTVFEGKETEKYSVILLKKKT